MIRTDPTPCRPSQTSSTAASSSSKSKKPPLPGNRRGQQKRLEPLRAELATRENNRLRRKWESEKAQRGCFESPRSHRDSPPGTDEAARQGDLNLAAESSTPASLPSKPALPS